MSLEQLDVIDAIGIEKETQAAVLTIIDSWTWIDEGTHLDTLQSKLNSYLKFIQTGQVWNTYPAAAGRHLRIDIVFRFPPTAAALELVRRAGIVASEIGIDVTHGTFEGDG